MTLQLAAISVQNSRRPQLSSPCSMQKQQEVFKNCALTKFPKRFQATRKIRLSKPSQPPKKLKTPVNLSFILTFCVMAVYRIFEEIKYGLESRYSETFERTPLIRNKKVAKSEGPLTNSKFGSGNLQTPATAKAGTLHACTNHLAILFATCFLISLFSFKNTCTFSCNNKALYDGGQNMARNTYVSFHFDENTVHHCRQSLS